MRNVTKTIHEVQFGKYRQEWEISFQYDDESIENLSVVAHNYNQGKYIGSNDITKTIPSEMIDAMIESIDVEEERMNEADAKFDNMFENEKGEDVFAQLRDFFKP